MNFSQKHFLLFTFLKCNVVYLFSWTAQIKAFIPGDQVHAERKGESERQEGDKGEKVQSVRGQACDCLCEYITGN